MARSQARRVESFTYLAREIPAAGMGHGCRGFEVEKLDPFQEPTGEVYHVLIDTRDGYSSCDCLGGEAHGHCKHREALAALIKAEQLPARYRSGGDMAANDPIGFDEHMESLAGHFDGPEPFDLHIKRVLARGSDGAETFALPIRRVTDGNGPRPAA